MKKFFAILIGLTAAAGVFAQDKIVFSDGPLSELKNDFKVSKTSDFEILSYVYFGLTGVKSEENSPEWQDNTKFYRNQEFGLNMAEFSFRPVEALSFTLGADVEWKWFHLVNNMAFTPYDPQSNAICAENGDHMSIQPMSALGIKEIMRTTYQVCTFGFPLNINYEVEDICFQLGGTLELNLNGRTKFEGIDLNGRGIGETEYGHMYSKKIASEDLTYNIHGAISYSGFGLYFRYRPVSIVKKDFGPQAQTWTLGIVLGLGE